MKPLLDWNLPHALRAKIPGHDCFTVAFKGRAAEDGFDVLLTRNANLQYQQNLSDLPVAVLVVRSRSNAIDDIRAMVPAVLDALSSLLPKNCHGLGMMLAREDAFSAGSQDSVASVVQVTTFGR